MAEPYWARVMASAMARRSSAERLSLLASRSRYVLSGQRPSQALIVRVSGAASAIAASTSSMTGSP